MTAKSDAELWRRFNQAQDDMRDALHTLLDIENTTRWHRMEARRVMTACWQEIQTIAREAK